MKRSSARIQQPGREECLRRSWAPGWAILSGLLVVLALASASPVRAQMAFPAGGAPQPSAPPSVLTPPDLPPGGRQVLCGLRDEVLDHADSLFTKLGLQNLFKNYYCDGGCFMCCKVPGNLGCHTSFDYNDDGSAPINCNSGTYGAGTTIVGEALVTGDPTGTGVCLAVQQVCNQFPVCSTAPDAAAATSGDPSAPPVPGTDSASTARVATSAAAGAAAASSPPPHPDMTLPGAIGSRAKAFSKAMLHHFTENVKNRPPGISSRDYVDFATARGARDWRTAMAEIEPYSESYSVFRVEDANGALLPNESHQLGVLYHANLALLGAVPNVLMRLAYVESRYWTEEEKTDYLGGVDPEAELRKTMGPVALEALQQVPIQDWRLLAVPAPNEPSIVGRIYEGFELGQAPTVNVALDCADPGETRLALDIEDPEASHRPDALYPVIVAWGDGSHTEFVYDDELATNVVSHRYAEAGSYVAYVTAANGTGLRGVAGIVVDIAGGGAAPNPPSIATLSLDPVSAYGPALIRAGDLAFELELRRPDGSIVEAGFSEKVTLANAGSTPLRGMTAYNEAQTEVDAVVLRPTSAGGYFYDSVYFKAPTITLGFFDPELGVEVTRTLPISDDMLEVYYAGAAAPVPPALLERDLNGALIFPVDRANATLPAGFCGASACKRVDRIEIPISPALLAARPDSGALSPIGLAAGDVARWREDVPNTFVPNTDLGAAVVPGSCGSSLPVSFVAANDPRESLVDSLTILGASPTVAGAMVASLEASATLADGRVVDVSDRVRWRSSDPNVLVIGDGFDKGRLSASTLPGTATLSASLGDLVATVDATNASPDRGYRTYRFQISEIHGSVGRAGLNAVEVIVDDVVQENKMTSLVEGTIGSFPADIASVPGGSAVNAFDASFGTGWTSPNNSFRTVAPYTVSAGPVYLQLAFEQPTPVSGIRLHRQAGILSASFLPQFPKQVVVEGSNDGVAFETVTTFDVQSWNYLPLAIPIPVPVPEPTAMLQLIAGSLAIAWRGRRRRPAAAQLLGLRPPTKARPISPRHDRKAVEGSGIGVIAE